MRRWAFPDPVYPHHFRLGAKPAILADKQALADSSPSAAKNIAPPKNGDLGTAFLWEEHFLLCLILVAGFAWCTTGGLQAALTAGETPPEAEVEDPWEKELALAKGRQCWTSCCAMAAGLLCIATFFLTLAICMAENRQAQRIDDLQLGINTTLLQIDDPGEHAFESGQGVALSFLLACWIVCLWRREGPVFINLSLLAHYAFRGAAFSSVIATFMEGIGMIILKKTAGRQEETMRVMLPLMLIVGVSEELAKALALLAGGAFLSSEALRRAGPAGCCGRSWRSLLDSPHAFVLAGMCVGFGFMAIENAGYLLAVGIETPLQELMANEDEDSEDIDPNNMQDPSSAMRLLRLMTITIRVLLNLHPWLAGLTAGRIARIAFLAPPRDTPSLKVQELAWALMPSVAMHALYDLCVAAAPGLFALFTPPLFWFAARMAFANEWYALTEAAMEQAAADAAVVEAAARAPPDGQQQGPGAAAAGGKQGSGAAADEGVEDAPPSESAAAGRKSLG